MALLWYYVFVHTSTPQSSLFVLSHAELEEDVRPCLLLYSPQSGCSDLIMCVHYQFHSVWSLFKPTYVKKYSLFVQSHPDRGEDVIFVCFYNAVRVNWYYIRVCFKFAQYDNFLRSSLKLNSNFDIYYSPSVRKTIGLLLYLCPPHNAATVTWYCVSASSPLSMTASELPATSNTTL